MRSMHLHVAPRSTTHAAGGKPRGRGCRHETKLVPRLGQPGRAPSGGGDAEGWGDKCEGSGSWASHLLLEQSAGHRQPLLLATTSGRQHRQHYRAQSSKFRDTAGQVKTRFTRFAPRPPPPLAIFHSLRMRRAELLPLLLPLLLLDSAFAWAVCTCSPHPSSRSTLSSSSRHRLGVLRLEAPSSPPSPPPEADADEERSKERTGGYYQGMVSSPLDFRVDEQLDNLTPNIKLVAGALGVCAALVAGFLAANGVL